MSKIPPNRPGIVFAVGARLEAQDYLQKWYASRIEKIDYEQGKMLIHFERWSHRYDEWIYWDSHRLRPLEGNSVQKEALKDEEEIIDFKKGDEVLARWTDCRYYPAKIEYINEEGTYTVQFYDGVIRSLKRIHVKSMPEDAKGQDWLALVKAATAAAAAAKSKPVAKHRVNKEKEERKMGRGSHFKKERRISNAKVKEDEAQKNQEEPVTVDISGNSEPLILEPKQNSAQAETSGTRKRKASVICSFQAKRARLNKITGLLASKAVSGDGSELLEDRIGSHPVPDQLVRKNIVNIKPVCSAIKLLPSLTSDQLKAEVSSDESCPLNQKRDPLSSTPSVVKLQTGKTKAENPSWNIKASDPSPIPTVPQGKEFHNIQFPQTLPPPPPSDIPQTGSDICQQPHGGSSSFEFSDLVPLDLSQNSRHKIPASVSSLQRHDEGQTMKHSKTITMAASSSVTNAKQMEDPLAPKEMVTELDCNKFKCMFPRCFKTFSKAKLLDYHMKYYHSAEKGFDPNVGYPESRMQTRATSVGTLTSKEDSLGLKRGRPLLTVTSPPSHLPALQPEKSDDICLKSSKVCKKKRSSASFGTDEADTHPIPSVKEKNTEIVTEKVDRRCVDRDRNAEVGIKTEKKMKNEEKSLLPGKTESKEYKDKEHDELKQQRKKKKKKKFKNELTNCEGFKCISEKSLEKCCSPVMKPGSSLTLRSGSVVKPAYLSPRSHLPSGSLLELNIDHVSRSESSLSNDESFDDSSTESALMSEDYDQDLDNSNPEESQEEDDSNAVVRCVCEMDKENGFMIQCEECLCWQHGICMGLLEDNIPAQYFCYICRDPPGQRWSAKYCYDKEWLKNGYMYGLSFLKENYSQQNAKKIISTHQLLADVYSVTEVLHGLQLKINILQSRKHPDLHLWAQSRIKSTQGQPTGEKIKECMDGPKKPEKVYHNQSHKGRSEVTQKVAGTYITDEHSYQKPQSYSLEKKTTIDHKSSEDEETSRSGDKSPVFKRTERQMVQKADNPSKQGTTDLKETFMILNDGNCDKTMEDEHINPQFPWQVNLLTHIEAVQNEVNNRMDLIEKELDGVAFPRRDCNNPEIWDSALCTNSSVLESWLDFSGDLEPPEPLARLPQLKRHIKQLLTDLGKVQQMACCCSL
ncbi:PHD finger protein 20-like protein 1 isoform X3 [Hypanus sabinus]|uniref:PHD finger protein 20-like protein 1 isoform X3 n=1 Tax=Hypanus sabinus TaxID=79690 RepID=UPI0028C47753|nr:PHD finger protein 20-like protein 1 isoform X3 [Hypanus sabinus]